MRTSPNYAVSPASESLKWESDIRAFEIQDAENPPVPGGIVFAGSSSIRKWENIGADFPAHRTIQRGFGGSQMSDVLHFADRIILPYRPAAVVIYEGDNDIGKGKTPQQVAMDYAELVHRIHVENPACRILFIAIKPSTKRWNLVDQIRETNALVESASNSDPRLFYVDVFNPMLGADGLPRPDLLESDGLHMTRAGYVIWARAVGAQLKEALN